MKKRFAAVLLCLCMLLTLTPTVAFAETQGTITDDNGVTLSYEVTSTPQNGAYYTEGEQVVIEVFITNDTSETIYDYKVDNGTTAYGQSLESGKSSGKMSGHFTVSAADVEAGTKSFEVGCTYKLNEQQYGDTLSQTITVLTGRKLEITDLTAVREDGELTVSSESNFAGSYAYALLNDGETAPTDWSGYSKAGVTEGTNSFTVSDTSEATKIVLMLWDENGEPLPNAPAEAEITVSTDPPTLEEGFAALTETATLPYSAEVDLGGEDTVLYDLGDDDFKYGKLLKVEVTDGQVLNMDFRGSGESVDTMIEIYRKTPSGQFEDVEYFDNDNSNGYGESVEYILPEAGIYYLAFLRLYEYETGLCRLDISVSDAPPIMTIEEGFAALTETATLPYSAEVDLGGEGSVLYTVVGDSFYAELLKVELKQGDILRMVFYGADGNYRDTYLEIYQENGSGGFTRLEIFDDNNMSGNGEAAYYTVPEDGVYYLAFEGYDEDVIGLCRLEAELLPAESIATGTLDFTADPAPVPGADALWSWDEESKTLTLKDGFALYNDDPDLGDLILLPDDATVVVEGSATVYNAGYRSIASEGSLTIRGAGAETANLEIVGGDCAIYADDDVIVTGSTVSASGGDVVIYSYDGCVRIENSTITAAPYYMLIGASGDVDIVDSNVSFTGAEIGIIADGTVTLDGGSFTGTFYTGGIGAEKIVLTGEPTLDLTGLDSDSELFRTGSIEVLIEDPVRIYDADGTVLYEGSWYDSLLDAESGMIVVDGTPAAGMEVHRHVYDRQVVSERYLAADATCTEPAKYYFSCECGEMGTETFESGIATGHTAGTAWKSDAAGHWNECAICGEKMNKAAHAYEWVTDKEATAAEAGSRHEECGVCGYVGVTESIAATDPSDSTDSGDKPDSTDDGETSGEPDTGDDGNPALWFALLLASGTAAACIAVYGRRKKRDR